MDMEERKSSLLTVSVGHEDDSIPIRGHGGHDATPRMDLSLIKLCEDLTMSTVTKSPFAQPRVDVKSLLEGADRLTGANPADELVGRFVLGFWKDSKINHWYLGQIVDRSQELDHREFFIRHAKSLPGWRTKSGPDGGMNEATIGSSEVPSDPCCQDLPGVDGAVKLWDTILLLDLDPVSRRQGFECILRLQYFANEEQLCLASLFIQNDAKVSFCRAYQASKNCKHFENCAQILKRFRYAVCVFRGDSIGLDHRFEFVAQIISVDHKSIRVRMLLSKSMIQTYMRSEQHLAMLAEKELLYSNVDVRISAPNIANLRRNMKKVRFLGSDEVPTNSVLRGLHCRFVIKLSSDRRFELDLAWRLGFCDFRSAGFHKAWVESLEQTVQNINDMGFLREIPEFCVDHEHVGKNISHIVKDSSKKAKERVRVGQITGYYSARDQESDGNAGVLADLWIVTYCDDFNGLLEHQVVEATKTKIPAKYREQQTVEQERLTKFIQSLERKKESPNKKLSGRPSVLPQHVDTGVSTPLTFRYSRLEDSASVTIPNSQQLENVQFCSSQTTTQTYQDTESGNIAANECATSQGSLKPIKARTIATSNNKNEKERKEAHRESMQYLQTCSPLPFRVSSLMYTTTVHKYGMHPSSQLFHDEHTLFPYQYKAVHKDPLTGIEYECEISNGREEGLESDGPAFVIKMNTSTPYTVAESTPGAAWKRALEWQLQNGNDCEKESAETLLREDESVLALRFGLQDHEVRRRLEGMEEALKCKKYIFLSQKKRKTESESTRRRKRACLQPVGDSQEQLVSNISNGDLALEIYQEGVFSAIQSSVKWPAMSEDCSEDCSFSLFLNQTIRIEVVLCSDKGPLSGFQHKKLIAERLTITGSSDRDAEYVLASAWNVDGQKGIASADVKIREARRLLLKVVFSPFEPSIKTPVQVGTAFQIQVLDLEMKWQHNRNTSQKGDDFAEIGDEIRLYIISKKTQSGTDEVYEWKDVVKTIRLIHNAPNGRSECASLNINPGERGIFALMSTSSWEVGIHNFSCYAILEDDLSGPSSSILMVTSPASVDVCFLDAECVAGTNEWTADVEVQNAHGYPAECEVVSAKFIKQQSLAPDDTSVALNVEASWPKPPRLHLKLADTVPADVRATYVLELAVAWRQAGERTEKTILCSNVCFRAVRPADPRQWNGADVVDFLTHGMHFSIQGTRALAENTFGEIGDDFVLLIQSTRKVFAIDSCWDSLAEKLSLFHIGPNGMQDDLLETFLPNGNGLRACVSPREPGIHRYSCRTRCGLTIDDGMWVPIEMNASPATVAVCSLDAECEAGTNEWTADVEVQNAHGYPAECEVVSAKFIKQQSLAPDDTSVALNVEASWPKPPRLHLKLADTVPADVRVTYVLELTVAWRQAGERTEKTILCSNVCFRAVRPADPRQWNGADVVDFIREEKVEVKDAIKEMKHMDDTVVNGKTFYEFVHEKLAWMHWLSWDSNTAWRHSGHIEKLTDKVRYRARAAEFSPINLGVKCISSNDIELCSGEEWSSHRECSKDVIGIGGQAQVYKAIWKKKNGKIVAVKVPNQVSSVNVQQLSERDKIVKEVQQLRRFRDAHVVHCYGLLLGPKILGIVMELADEGDLAKLIEKISDESKPDLSWKDWTAIARGAAKGLCSLHSHKIVHKDVKSHNILLFGKTAKISDLGVAVVIQTLTTGRQPKFTAACGTYNFMAPEADDLESKAPEADKSNDLWQPMDVWSFGAVLYHIITHEMPFKGLRPEQIIVRKQGPVPLNPKSNARLKCPKAMIELCIKCGQKDPKVRPRMEEIVEALDSHDRPQVWGFFARSEGIDLRTENKSLTMVLEFKLDDSFLSYRPIDSVRLADFAEAMKKANERNVISLLLSGHCNKDHGFAFCPHSTAEPCQGIIEILREHYAGHGNHIVCIFLNACEGVNLGKKLIEVGVKYVICWKDNVHDKKARKFSLYFYTLLASGIDQDYEQAFRGANEMVQTSKFEGMRGTPVLLSKHTPHDFFDSNTQSSAPQDNKDDCIRNLAVGGAEVLQKSVIDVLHGGSKNLVSEDGSVMSTGFPSGYTCPGTLTSQSIAKTSHLSTRSKDSGVDGDNDDGATDRIGWSATVEDEDSDDGATDGMGNLRSAAGLDVDSDDSNDGATDRIVTNIEEGR